MPSGPIHNSATLTVAATSAVIVLYQSNGDWRSALYCAGGALVGLVLSPDLDLAENQVNWDTFLHRPVSWLWHFAWMFYGKVCRHRSIASHMPIFSTLLRLAYIGMWLFPLWLYYGWESPPLKLWMLWGWFGLTLSDSLHWLLDFIDNLLGGRL